MVDLQIKPETTTDLTQYINEEASNLFQWLTYFLINIDLNPVDTTRVNHVIDHPAIRREMIRGLLEWVLRLTLMHGVATARLVRA